MCGIVGIFHFGMDEPIDRALLGTMNELQRHRGPDAGGLHVETRIGLGNRRLAIVDRAHGHQPMSNEDGSVWITYNGEVFNHAEIRADLEARGVRFRTQSDTEVVLQAFITFGPACVDHFNGQFAFALWDAKRETLFLARDRLGITPLHFAMKDGIFVFASEAKAILSHPRFATVTDHEAVAESMLCNALFHGRTLFRDVKSLEPGHTLTVTAAGAVKRQYWDVPLEPRCEGDHSEAFYTERLLPLLTDAMKIRTMGEVPWGLMLSGGTDSSTLSALATAMFGAARPTFTVDYPNRWKGDNVDAHYAQIMAEHLQTQHHCFLIDPEAYIAALEKIAWHVEHPFNKGAATMYLLYERIREHVTVILSGEGADELFAGDIGSRGLGLDDVLAAGEIRILPWAPHWEIMNSLFSDDFRHAVDPEEIFRQRLADSLAVSGTGDLLTRALYLYCKHFLLELLEYHDRTSLAFGIEGRQPFLDHRFVELFFPMPSEFKWRNGQTKYLFKKVIEPLVPHEIIHRRKTHMPIPRDPVTVMNQLRMVRELVLSPTARSRGYFDQGRIGDLLERRGIFEGVDMVAVWQITMQLITLEMNHRVFAL